MMRSIRLAGAAFALAIMNAAAHAQFEPPTVERGPKLPPVEAFPAAGDYSNTTGVTLRGPAGAAIHYTMDGSKPTEDSPLFDPSHLIFLNGIYDGDRGLTTGYTIRAVAVQDGHTNSDPATFSYTIARRDWTDYVSEEVAPGVRMVRDSNNDKLFLVRGRDRFVLIDTGMGRGDLPAYLSQFTGGLPVTLIVTHSHGDHIAQVNRFIGTSTVNVGAPDRPAVAEFLKRQGVADADITARLRPVGTGSTVDLGDRALEIVLVPGHTPGSLAVFDPQSGNLFTGDTFGNNSPLPPDVMWLQWASEPLDDYLANMRAARRLLGDRVQRIMTGHNDRPLIGTTFFDNLEIAIQRGLDEGEAALLPSLRPPDGVQLVEGDRFTDPNWFGVNVNPKTFLPAPPDQNARIGDLAVAGVMLEPAFSPEVTEYRLKGSGPATVSALPSSRRASKLTLNGSSLEPGASVRLEPGRDAVIEVVSGAGSESTRYRLVWDD